MPTARKEASVAELKALVERASIVVGAEYRGLTVKEVTALRRTLREAGVEVRVVKNRLFQIAAAQAGVPDAGQVVEGPTMIVFGYGDIVAPSKVIADTSTDVRTSTLRRRIAGLRYAVAADSRRPRRMLRSNGAKPSWRKPFTSSVSL